MELERYNCLGPHCLFSFSIKLFSVYELTVDNIQDTVVWFYFAKQGSFTAADKLDILQMFCLLSFQTNLSLLNYFINTLSV